jgi:hypothetical protein
VTVALIIAVQGQLVRQHGLWRPYPKGPLVLAIFLPAYFLPTMLGWRGSRRWKVAAVNVFLGWTVVGWVVAMLMAMRPPAEADAATTSP